MPESFFEINAFLGIDNTSDMMSVSIPRKAGVYCYEIDNVDIDDNFKPHRREGYKDNPLVNGTNVRSLWASPTDKICLFASGTIFYKLNTNDTTTALITGVDSTDNFAYVEIGNFVYFSNMSIVGYIDTRVGTSSTFPTPTQTFKTKMVGGQILEYHYNRLYAANGANVFYSDATILTQMDKRKNAIAVPSRVIMMKSVIDGMYVGDLEKVYFWSGRDPSEFVSREVLNIPAIEGMSVPTIAKKRKASVRTVYFNTEKGVFEGYPEGIVVQKQEGRFAMSDLDKGCAIIRNGNYQQFLSIGKMKAEAGGSSGEFRMPIITMEGD